MSVGAESVTDYGDYFAWGETKAKETYSWDTYTLETYDSNDKDNYGMTKYTTDGTTTLALEDDAANANWGGDWRMPTMDEINELRNNCTWTWTSSYEESNVAGYVVTGTNGNSIFLPAAGVYGTSLSGVGNCAYYWSSSLYTDSYEAYGVYIYNPNVFQARSSRCTGEQVRPVRSSSSSE